MTVTKAHLAGAIQKRLGIPRKKASFLIDSFLEILKETLESGDEILISRFGKFSVKEVGRDGTRRQGNSDVLNRMVTFRCSPVLQKKLNGKKED
jgi:integration host factor subunit alpha